MIRLVLLLCVCAVWAVCMLASMAICDAFGIPYEGEVQR